MTPRSRVIRLDLSNTLYAPLEHHALTLDVGVTDLLRHLIVDWAKEHPLPPEDEPS